MCHNRRLVDTLVVHIDLPTNWTGVKSYKFLRLTQRIDALIHFWKVVPIAFINDALMTIGNKKTETSGYIRNEYNGQG